MGIKNTVVTNETPERLAERFPSFFDRILVDAPCSGEGMFRKDEEAREHWSLENVGEICASRQIDILKSAATMLKPGGRLVYSTCTFSPRGTRRHNESL
ncbi:NOL1/NOP2/sun family putative RNA methylase OS=Ureibacillus acetophenoni OX=614649 GN=SAMN05877842_10619 PE=3 SV=1 [Ureibacillus acetophenoni]